MAYQEPTTSNTTIKSSSGNGFLYFAVGALIVAVAVLGYMFYNGSFSGKSSTDNAIERSATAIGDAADKIGNSARDAARSIPAPAPAPAQPAPQPPATPG